MLGALGSQVRGVGWLVTFLWQDLRVLRLTLPLASVPLSLFCRPCGDCPPTPCAFPFQEEAQKQQELAKAEIQKVLKEKEQLSTDLSSMEKSFSDLFKRFEKQKAVIEGYRTVGGLCPVSRLIMLGPQPVGQELPPHASWSLELGTWLSLAVRWAVRPVSPCAARVGVLSAWGAWAGEQRSWRHSLGRTVRASGCPGDWAPRSQHCLPEEAWPGPPLPPAGHVRESGAQRCGRGKRWCRAGSGPGGNDGHRGQDRPGVQGGGGLALLRALSSELPPGGLPGGLAGASYT